MKETVGSLARITGVSLRPWSGHAPLSLIIRGLIHVAICGVILTVLIRGFFGTETINASDAAMIRGLVIPGIIALIILMVIGAVRVLVGCIDLIPRKHIAGVVVSVRERKVGDVLPILAQRVLFERNENNIDRRRRRTEVVLLTDQGEQQWTVRNSRVARALTIGSRVRLTVTPLAGYVAQVEPLS